MSGKTSGGATSSIAVVGAAGTVGSTVAYSLILNPIASDILLVDPQTEIVEAQAQDLSDAVYQSNTAATRVHVSEPKEAGQSDIIIITAGAAQKKGESRTDLIQSNLKILKSVIDGLKPIRKDAVVLVVANPVDVLVYFAQKFCELPKEQVFGSGTFLDSARLRGLLGKQIGVSSSNVDAYVLGEHGESQVVAWSSVKVGGVSLEEVDTDGKLDQDAMAEDTRKKAASIIDAKGTTNYGIGSVVASICRSILLDKRDIRSVSTWQEKYGVCFSMPAVLGGSGIMRNIPINLSEEESKKVGESAKSLKKLIEDAEKQSEE